MTTKAERARYEAERNHPRAKPAAIAPAAKKPTHAEKKRAEGSRKDAQLLGRAELAKDAPTARYREAAAKARRTP